MNQPPNTSHIQQAYQLAQERYAGLGVDIDQALEKLAAISISPNSFPIKYPQS